jgi:hypothetical protein
MHFSARISSDWVFQQWSQGDSVRDLPLQKYDEAVCVLCQPSFRTLNLHHQGALMMEAASTSETSVNSYQTIWRSIPEDSHHLKNFFLVHPHLTILPFRTEQRTSFKTSLVRISVTVQHQTGVCLIISTQTDPRNIPYKFGRNLPVFSVYNCLY